MALVLAGKKGPCLIIRMEYLPGIAYSTLMHLTQRTSLKEMWKV